MLSLSYSARSLAYLQNVKYQLLKLRLNFKNDSLVVKLGCSNYNGTANTFTEHLVTV